ncbi:FbpB family small basic protein [Bacillus sp. SW7]
MRRSRRKSFDELVKENKQQLLSDRDAIDRIEERIEKRYEMKFFKQAE